MSTIRVWRQELPTQQTLLNVLDYNKECGSLVWKIRPSPLRGPGEIAGYCSKKGWVIQYKSKIYKTNRIIWKMVHNEEPLVVDHKNGNKFDNRLCNLRAATVSQNNMNRRVGKNNILGIKGVGKQGNKYRASITVDGKGIDLGPFSSLEEAVAARLDAESKYQGDFSYVNSGRRLKESL